MAHTVLRLPAVKSRTGLSRSSIYKFAAEGRFPRPICLGARSVGWLEEEINEWLDGRLGARNTSPESRQTRRECR
jgi:prophage regulatory protein